MNGLAVLLALSLVSRWVYLFMEWQGDRIHRQMVAGVQEVLRSRASGSEVALDCAAQAPRVTRAGVETGADTPQALPAPQILVGAAQLPAPAAPTRNRVVLSPHYSASAG